MISFDTPAGDGPEPLLRLEDVAALLRISKSKASRMMHAGEFGNPVNIGSDARKQLRIRPEAVAAYLARREIPIRASA